MARRSDHSRDELRRLALDAAAALAEEGGLPAITARAVAGRIGYAAGTLYNIFDNLDGLILALNDRTLESLEVALDSLGPPTGNPGHDLNALLNLYAAQVDAAPRLWALLIEHSLPDGQSAPDWYRARIARLLERLETALAPALAHRPEARASEEVAQSARLLWLSVHGLLTAGQTGTIAAVGAAEGKILARDLIETYLAGLKARNT